MKKIVVLMVLVLSACTTVMEDNVRRSKADPLGAAKQRVALAAEYLRSGEDEKAQIELKQALEKDPDSADAHLMMAILLDRDGDAMGAEKNYKKAIKLKEDFSQANNNYGIFLYKKDRYAQAFEQFQLASNDLGYSFRAQAFEGMGLSAFKLNRKDAAEAAFQRALKLDAQLQTSTLYRAELALGRSEAAQAQELYKQFLVLNEGQPQTAQSLWLGIRLARLRADKNALASYELALKRLYPTSIEFQQYQSSLK